MQQWARPVGAVLEAMMVWVAMDFFPRGVVSASAAAVAAAVGWVWRKAGMRAEDERRKAVQVACKEALLKVFSIKTKT